MFEDTPEGRTQSYPLFELMSLETMEEVRKHIQDCESKHTQQAIYSTYHDALTQVCYGCRKIRTTINTPN